EVFAAGVLRTPRGRSSTSRGAGGQLGGRGERFERGSLPVVEVRGDDAAQGGFGDCDRKVQSDVASAALSRPPVPPAPSRVIETMSCRRLALGRGAALRAARTCSCYRDVGRRTTGDCPSIERSS